MNKYDYDTFDSTINDIFIKLYNLSLNNRDIILTNISLTSVEHKCYMRICALAQTVFGFEIKVKLPFIKYVLFRIFYKYKWKRTKKTALLDVEDEIRLIQENKEIPNILTSIYNEYYRKVK